MSAHDNYFQIVQAQLAAIYQTQSGNIERAAESVATALRNERFIYTFGSGHSHTAAEETFYRAGGLARAVAILDEKLMVHESAVASTEWERKEGYAKEVLSRYAITAGDVLFVVSNSGRNAVPIEMAMEGAARGAKVIAITSVQYSSSVSSRHSSGKKLSDVAHLTIDNFSIAGDAAVSVPGFATKTGPTSTITSAFILNSILVEAVERSVAAGSPVEVWGSANSDNTSNESLLAKYRGRIPHL
ncbi:MAG: hypothetical protein JWM68_4038 [Verrucomicrobiales bacterium]|nr:hypothetical protein [Verrucomicrobiales bacterium]